MIISYTRFIDLLVLSGLVSSFLTSGKVSKDVQESTNGLLSSKRGLGEFFVMIGCQVSRNPLDFNDYGCWCGIGGNGTALDELDSCCRDHDNCFRSLRLSGACGLLEQYFPFKIYTMQYSVKDCTVCEPASYYWYFGECRSSLCECDAEAAKCFSNHEDKYNEEFKSYPKNTC